MERRFDSGVLRLCKGDVRDVDRILDVMSDVNIVIHAAALKRVEGSQDASETVKTNVDGSRNVVRAAIERRVERVMGISSDKACQAVTLYGATKLVMEQLFTEPHGRSRTEFAICRYGNVVGSSGSIVPLFMDQARRLGHITITDPRCSRFWVGLDDAVRWVKRRVELMEPGRIYVPILPSAWVVDIARAVDTRAERVVVGMRGMEKLHEQLIGFDESRTARRVADPTTLDYFALGGAPTGAPEFVYSSDGNEKWLSLDQIRVALSTVMEKAA
jgi:UDP-N-acetylglucosamine 4,6-dehydratase